MANHPSILAVRTPWTGCPADVVLLFSYLIVESCCRLGARVWVVRTSSEYVSPEQLAGFDKYKYSAADTSPLSLYVMHPFWNTVVQVLPTWLAPDPISFSGLLLVVFNFLLMAYSDPDFYASAPGHKHVPDWVWIVVGILNSMACTLDGVDGNQTRRTSSSTALGELFDQAWGVGHVFTLSSPCIPFLDEDHLVPVFLFFISCYG